MSRSLFSLVAAAVTAGGMAAVVWAARPPAWPVIDLAVLLGAVGGVLLIEGGLQTPAAVAVFLAVAGVVDFLSMSGGLSRVLVERYRAGSNDLLLYLTLVAPVRGRAIPIVGIGDLLVGGAAATALLRLGLRPVAVLGTITAGLLTALAYGLWRGGAPALPFIAVAVFFLIWRHRGSV